MTANTPHELKKRLWKELKNRVFVFIGLTGGADRSVPMTLHTDGDNHRSLWIFTTKDGPLSALGAAQAQYIAKDQDIFARIEGQIASETDVAVIDRLWNARVAAWYQGGRDDPNLAVVRFDVGDAEIWLAEISPLTMVKMMVGANVRDDVQDQHATVQAGT